MDSAVTLPIRDLEALLDAAEGARRATPGQDAVQELLSPLAGLVRCDRLYWNRTRVTAPVRQIIEIGLPEPLVRYPFEPNGLYQEWAAHREEHPIMSGRHGPVVSVSDVYPPREFQRTWLYQTFFQPHGVRHEIGVHLSHPADEIRVVFLSRLDGPDFDDRDHLILRLLRPHLDAALRRIASPAPSLTPRQAQVLRLVRDGLTDTQIARRLAISEATVGKHLEHIYAQTGARSRIQAVTLCADALDHPAPPAPTATTSSRVRHPTISAAARLESTRS